MIRKSKVTLEITWDDESSVEPSLWDWGKVCTSAKDVSVLAGDSVETAFRTVSDCLEGLPKKSGGGLGLPQVEFMKSVLWAAEAFISRETTGKKLEVPNDLR